MGDDPIECPACGLAHTTDATPGRCSRCFEPLPGTATAAVCRPGGRERAPTPYRGDGDA